MDSAVQISYARVASANERNTAARILSALISAGCLTLLIVAASLKPSHLGYATHRGLGLPECEFMQRTGIPCPSCGMTTSFAWFVRGNIAASLYVQPMGTVVAALCGVGVWIGLYIAVTGRPVYQLLGHLPARYIYCPLLAFGIAGWAWKIYIHLHGHDGW